MDMNFMLLIDTGFEILDEEEVKIYANFIADYFGYDRKNFYKLLEVIAKSTGNPDRMPGRVKVVAQAGAISQIFRDIS